MTYKTIILHLDSESQAPGLIEYACNVAEQHDAHLVGLFIVHPFQMYVGRVAGYGVASDLPMLLTTEQIDKMKRLHNLFDAETKNQNFVAEWRMIDERLMSIADTLLQEATTADLLIIGHNEDDHFSKELVHSVLLDSPTPIVIVPDNIKIATVGQNILIAWDGKNEVARAVIGAQPLLQMAQSVVLHHVRTTAINNIAMESNIKCMAEKLSRHGIQVEIAESTSERKDIGKTISGVIRDRSIDCVVMGAYGHSNIRNLILGSTTDYALNNLKVPLSMWH